MKYTKRHYPEYAIDISEIEGKPEKKNRSSKYYQLHCEIERDLAERLKELLPVRGLISYVIREFLINYVKLSKGGLDSKKITKIAEKIKEDKKCLSVSVEAEKGCVR